MSTTNYQSLIDRITAFRKSASADANAVAKQDDVQNVSNPAIPVDPESAKKKLGMPADGSNQKATPGEADGNEQSEVKPQAPVNVAANNDNVSKMANNISDIAARAAALLQGQQQQAEPTKQAANVATEAQALDAAIELSPEFHFKLASAILETEEGIKMAEAVLMRHRGQQEAHALIKEAMVAHGEFVKAAAEQEQLQQIEALIIQDQLEKNAAIEEIAKQLSQEEQSEVVKIASAHAKASSVLTETEKHAYAAGAADAEEMMAGEEGGGEAEDMEGGASLEELLQVLGMLVESGEIDEATAQQVAEQLMAAEGQGGAEGESESAESPEEEAGEEAAKSASAILQHLGA